MVILTDRNDKVEIQDYKEALLGDDRPFRAVDSVDGREVPGRQTRANEDAPLRTWNSLDSKMNSLPVRDDYAVHSFERGIAAQDAGSFAWEIVPVEVPGGRGRPSTIVDKDEGLGKFDARKLRKLKPSFKETGGTVTAGNASSISDGATALVLVSGEKTLKLGLKVIAKISRYVDAAQAPELFTTTPALAIPKAISITGLEASKINYYEINEAFAVVALANQKILGLSPEKVNVHGGAVSLGHPLGCSGARILVTLLGMSVDLSRSSPS